MAVKVKKEAVKQSAKPEAAKPAAAAAAPKGEKKSKAPAEKREGKAKAFRERITYAAKMVKAQKYTDEQIVAEVNEKFPQYVGKKFDKKECDRTRWMIKNNLIHGIITADWPYESCVEFEGKIYPRSKKPRPPKKSRAKVDPANDPLKKVAGVDVSKNKEKAKPEAKAEAKPEAAKA